MQTNESAKVNKPKSEYHGQAGRVIAVDGDKVTVKLDLVDEPVTFKQSELIYLG